MCLSHAQLVQLLHSSALDNQAVNQSVSKATLHTFLLEDLHAWNVYSSCRSGGCGVAGGRLELGQIARQLFTKSDLHGHDPFVSMPAP